MISIVIPAFDEEKNIPRIKTELIPILRKMGEYEIIVIDDGSKDRTAKETKRLIKSNRRIRLVRHGANKGLGCAVRTGLASSRGEVIIILDADFTFHPREIPKLYEAYRKGYDCVIGSHFGRGGRTEEVPLLRLLLSRTVNMLYSVLLGKRLSSVSSIFRVYNASMVKALALESAGFDINAEILFKLLQKKACVIEVPVTLTTRRFGESKINISKAIRSNMKMLWQIFSWRLGFI